MIRDIGEASLEHYYELFLLPFGPVDRMEH